MREQASVGMSRGRLTGVLAAQRRYCEGKAPTYVDVLRALEADAAAGSAWLGSLEEAWRRRAFAVGWEAAHLLLAGLHFWALKGSAPELAAAFPSCGGSGRGAGEAARSFLRRAPDAFWRRLSESFVQTNEVDRSVAWMLAAAGAFGPRELPFHLVELGTSAGLNLIGDRLPHACGFEGVDGGPGEPPGDWDRPGPLLTRTGLDLRPRRLADAEDRLWLKACVWADDLPRLERLDRAIELFLGLEGARGGPTLERCSFSLAPAWLARHRPAEPGAGLLVFNSIATVYLSDAEYEALSAGLSEVLAPWDGRALWVEFERSRAMEGGPLELAVRRARGGGFDTRILGDGEPRPRLLRLRPGWEFLPA